MRQARGPGKCGAPKPRQIGCSVVIIVIIIVVVVVVIVIIVVIIVVITTATTATIAAVIVVVVVIIVVIIVPAAAGAGPFVDDFWHARTARFWLPKVAQNFAGPGVHDDLANTIAPLGGDANTAEQRAFLLDVPEALVA